VVEELRKKEINGPIRVPKRDFFTRGQKVKVKDPWHTLSGYDLEFAGMSTRERVRVMLEWFGRRQTIALPINSVVGCPDCNHSAPRETTTVSRSTCRGLVSERHEPTPTQGDSQRHLALIPLQGRVSS
jgi:hypothetical protein